MRRIELSLLAFVQLLVVSGMELVDTNVGQSMSWSTWSLCLIFAALCAGVHLAVRKLAPGADELPLPCAALINGIGLIIIHRLDLAYAIKAQQNGTEPPGADAPRQLIFVAVGMGLFVAFLALVRDHRKLSRYAYIAGVLGIVLLILPGVLPSSISEVNGAKLWIRMGPFSLQPGEFSKILVIIFAAGFLVAKRELFTSAGKRVLGMELPRARDLGPLLVAWLASVCVVTFEKELGAALLFFGVALAMIYVATERVSWIVVGVVFFVVGCVVAYQLFTHIQQRVSTWIDPLATYDQPGGGYQVAQSLFGLGTGGLTGTGLGLGRPDLVPFAGTDFISGAIGEELGLVGLVAVLMLYLLLTSRGVRAALSTRDTFGKLLASGLAFSVALQVFVVVGGVTGLIPLAGMTMPFLSYGGSSLLSNYLLVAVVLRVSASASASHGQAPAKESLARAKTELVARPVRATGDV